MKSKRAHNQRRKGEGKGNSWKDGEEVNGKGEGLNVNLSPLARVYGSASLGKGVMRRARSEPKASLELEGLEQEKSET